MYTPKLIMHGADTTALSEQMARATDARTMRIKRRIHNDGGMELQITDNMRGHDVICVPNATGNPQTNFVQGLSMVANAKAGGANSVTALLLNPFEERADKKVDSRGIPMFHVLADALRPHCNEVVLVDPHNLDASDVFRGGNVTSVTNVNMAFPIAIQLKHLVNQGVLKLEDLYPVHADAGSTKRITPEFRNCVKSVLGWDYSNEKDDWAQAFNRRNPRTGEKSSQGLGLTGDVEGKVAIIFEDIGDTMTTLCTTARDLKKAGAKAVIGYVSKGHFSPKKKDIEKGIMKDEPITASIDRINESEMDLLLTTDAIAHTASSGRGKALKESNIVHTMSVGAYLGAYISALHMPASTLMNPDANSVSALNRGTHPDMDTTTQALFEPIDLKEGCPLLDI